MTEIDRLAVQYGSTGDPVMQRILAHEAALTLGKTIESAGRLLASRAVALGVRRGRPGPGPIARREQSP